MKLSTVVVAILLLTFSTAFGQEFYPTDQKTVGWERAENATVYYVFVRSAPAGEAVKVGETAETSFTVTVPAEGKWLIGVQSVRVEETVVVGESTISWSDNPEVCFEGNTFGLIHYGAPAAVGGLRVN